jgi:hypothetical protein
MDVNPAHDEVLHLLAHVHRPARGAENRATLLMTPRQLERDARFRTDFDPLGDRDIVANRVAERGSEARFAEGV